jgi:hypothetical protein
VPVAFVSDELRHNSSVTSIKSIETMTKLPKVHSAIPVKTRELLKKNKKVGGIKYLVTVTAS